MISDNKILPIEKLKDIYNTPDEKSAIKAVCRRILASLNLSNAPIPLKPICQRFNLRVTYNNVVKKEDSFLKLSPNGFEIEISKQKNWRRNRFTIAHELTHLIILNAIGAPVNSVDKKQHDEIERLCDIGASELLINEDELSKSLKEYGLSSEGLKALYDKFMVSYDALFLKLSEYLNANILIWRNYARNESERKEYRVLRHFPKYKNANKTIWLPNGCTKKHVNPDPFKQVSDNQTFIFDDFKILINDKITKCSALTFVFPHSRNIGTNLPIFDDLIITDETSYNDCVVMFVFEKKNRFDHIKENYLKS